MPVQVISPNEHPEFTHPVIFLAGPIQGAPDWHTEAIDWFQKHAADLTIATPKRIHFDQKVSYEEQVDWETRYLNQAALTGVVLFWLAREQNHSCERPFAQTTRFELGEWKAKHEQTGCSMVLGIDEGFSNTRYFHRRFGQDCPKVPICQTLEETCAKALELIID
ncbi:nucleoside 2-deoxyribosyltransferase domain-containing protein [Kiritimatiellaeota bacterium B1221]|nr:nucleoside 2-deoxyribosyltransferase domain-containing protein [Kiritimatiellaeota bacterium B1221]